MIQKAIEEKIVQEMFPNSEEVDIKLESSSDDPEPLSSDLHRNLSVPFDQSKLKSPISDSDGEEENREFETRELLPAERDPNNKPSIWKVLKDMIGKDLSRFAIPVYFNEPVSFV
jgi:hypothetical protein